jgi:hypothetical protein
VYASTKGIVSDSIVRSSFEPGLLHAVPNSPALHCLKTNFIVPDFSPVIDPTLLPELHSTSSGSSAWSTTDPARTKLVGDSAVPRRVEEKRGRNADAEVAPSAANAQSASNATRIDLHFDINTNTPFIDCTAVKHRAPDI